MVTLALRQCAIALLSLSVVPLALSASAAEVNKARALYHYQMFCQGCHTPDGSGNGDIPALKDFMGYFMNTDQGRAFLVRVPGSATSKLDDQELAEVLNWCLAEFAGVSLPVQGYAPYSAAEVSVLRAEPLEEIEQHRAAVLLDIVKQRQQPAL